MVSKYLVLLKRIEKLFNRYAYFMTLFPYLSTSPLLCYSYKSYECAPFESPPNLVATIRFCSNHSFLKSNKNNKQPTKNPTANTGA